jgi:hypothetical protein
MKKIMVIGRRRHFDRVYSIAEQLFPQSQIQLWSDERLGGESVRWMGERFYKNFSKFKGVQQVDGFGGADIDDMILRCRYLRNVDRSLATQIAVTSFSSWVETLSEESYDHVFTLPVDSYPTDSLVRAARYLGVPAHAPVTTPFAGRIRFTLKGEIIKPQTPADYDQKELKGLMEIIKEPSYQAAVLMGIDTPATSTIIRRLLIDSIKPPFFLFYRWLKQDPLSFSFPRRALCRQTMFATPTGAGISYAMEKRKTTDFPKKYAFIPLQFYPESTTDYWVQEKPMTNHYKVVLSIIDALKGHLPIVIKEHPTALGRRPAFFIKELIKRGVVFAPTLLPTGDLVKNSTITIGSGTTTMLQALLHQRPILFAGTPFYSVNDGLPTLKSLDNLNSIRDQLMASIESPGYGEEVTHQVLERYFTCSTPGHLGSYKIIGEKSVSQQKPAHIPKETVDFFNDLSQ